MVITIVKVNNCFLITWPFYKERVLDSDEVWEIRSKFVPDPGKAPRTHKGPWRLGENREWERTDTSKSGPNGETPAGGVSFMQESS